MYYFRVLEIYLGILPLCFFIKLSFNFRVYQVLEIFSCQGNNHPVKHWGRYFLLKEFIYGPWRRKWQLTPVFLPGKPHGWRSLVGYSPSVCKESDMTEWLTFTYDMHWSFNPKGNQLWIFIGRTDAEADVPNAKSWLMGKDLDAGKDWRQEEKGATKDKLVGWHHQLNGHEFEQTLVGGERQGNLVFYSSWGHKELEIT